MVLLAALLACPGDTADSATTSPPDDSATDTHAHTDTQGQYLERRVRVTLDGVPTAGIAVFQGGTSDRYRTDANGEVQLTLDTSIEGEIWVVAAHPEARSWVDQPFLDTPGDLAIALTRFDPSDNEGYQFGDPGTPTHRDDTSTCAHCHVTLNQSWYESPHRTTASNPRVQDIYAGAVAALTDAAACADAGGSWWPGLTPGTAAAGERCYLGAGALPDLNPDCGDTASCDGVATATGQCADCHAPAINGALGGHDLLQATGIAYDYGVSCDLCHKVERVDVDAPAGVAGRLGIVRPTQTATSRRLGLYQPLSFGPFDDVPGIVMGGVARDHFASGEICSGCHQLDQAVLVPGATLDRARWPDGTLPIHTTWQEWSDGPLAGDAPCQSCHMPPDPTVGNAADLGNVIDDVDPGLVAGWYREPGSVRQHSWVGPRTPESGMLELAATVDVAGTVSDGVLSVDATVANVGPGHALPTGEPLRHLLLRVDARCDGTPLDPVGGDVLPGWAGSLDHQDADGDWSLWPGAAIGDVVVVVRQTGDFHDYVGTGPFGDGTFDAAAKGLPVEHGLGRATVVQVDGPRVTLDVPLPEGDRAYRLPAGTWPADGDPSAPLAGLPGFAWAKVLADADGTPMVPHHRAVDVVSDNRLLPGQRWTSTHRFTAACEAPTLHATLLYRSAPLDLGTERRWELTDRVMAQVTR